MRYAPGMTWFEIAQSFALAFWPVWVVLAALLVVWVASRFGYMAPDEYEEPPAHVCELPPFPAKGEPSFWFTCGCGQQRHMGKNADDFHNDQSWGR